MAQARVLGNLQYKEAEHGWALDVGSFLARYDLLQNDFTDETIPGMEAARRDTVETINDKLAAHNVHYSVPAITAGARVQTSRIVVGLLDRMKEESSPSQSAFMLIGNAAYLLGIRNASSVPGADVEFIRLALNRLELIQVQCDGIKLDPNGLLIRLMESDISPIGLRILLRNLPDEKMSILIVSADPRNEARLQLQEEHRQLMDALRAAQLRDAFKVDILPSCRPQDLAPAIRRTEPTIIHFSGHGSYHGLCFVDEFGNAQDVDPTNLGNLLALAHKKHGLKGVLMNACYAETQATQIAEKVGYVIAMEGELSDKSAINFAREFYAALGDGVDFDTAFEWGLHGAELMTSAGPLRPRLIKSRASSGMPSTGSSYDMKTRLKPATTADTYDDDLDTEHPAATSSSWPTEDTVDTLIPGISGLLESSQGKKALPPPPPPKKRSLTKLAIESIPPSPRGKIDFATSAVVPPVASSSNEAIPASNPTRSPLRVNSKGK